MSSLRPPGGLPSHLGVPFLSSNRCPVWIRNVPCRWCSLIVPWKKWNQVCIVWFFACYSKKIGICFFKWANFTYISKSVLLRETLQCRNCGCHMLFICCFVMFLFTTMLYKFSATIPAFLTTWFRWSVACKHATGCDAGSHGGAWSVSWCWIISKGFSWERSGRKKSGCKIKL